MHLTALLNHFRIGIRNAVIEMGHHKLRSFLSMLGVMLGVAALVAMLTLIGGINVFLNEKIGKWAGQVWIWRSHNPSDNDKLSWSRSPGLRLSDGDFLKKESAPVIGAYGRIDRRESVSIAGREYRRVRLRGTDEASFTEDMELLIVDRGVTLTASDFNTALPACLISWDLAEQVARDMRESGRDTTRLIGSQVNYQGIHLPIIGTIAPKDEQFKPWHMRWSITMPIKTMQERLTGTDPDPGSVTLRMSDPSEIESQAEIAARSLTGRHRGARDFEYRANEWAENMKQMMSNVSVIMSIISLISLVSGGIGIMNVMLSSIAERIREIGVRKALGARDIQIFIQFLTETTTLSCVGGSLGAFIGLIPLAFSDAIKQGSDGAIAPTILPEHAVFVFLVVVFVGIVFGLYPAVRASRMDPIEALRYE